MDLKLCQIYKLKTEDSLIIHNDNNKNIYLILEGALIISKIFTNKEILSLGIFTSQDIITIYFDNTLIPNYFYRIQALSDTYIISIHNNQSKLLKEIISIQYKQTLLKYQNMIEILAHKNVKNRFIHLLLTLSETFGVTSEQHIYINLTLSYYTITTIIGGNRNTISKLIKNLEQNKIITYDINKIIIFNLIKLSLYKYQ